MNILRIDSSARFQESITRKLADDLILELQTTRPTITVNTRDLAGGLPVLTADWVSANFTDPAERTNEQQAVLSFSDQLIAELKAAELVVIAAPIYNFSIPATLKTWIDHICRARESFRYTEKGPEGLITDRPVYIVMASGGVPIGSSMDYASPYLRQLFSFIGITNIHFITTDNFKEIVGAPA